MSTYRPSKTEPNRGGWVCVDLAAIRREADGRHLWSPFSTDNVTGKVDLEFCYACGAFKFTGRQGSVAIARGMNAPAEFHSEAAFPCIGGQLSLPVVEGVTFRGAVL